jgi:hypothetical protein
MNIRRAGFALRIVRRRMGDAAILYRRRLTDRHEERLDRVAAISPLAFAAGGSLLRGAVRAAGGSRLAPGPFLPLDADWGSRVACFAVVAAGLRNAERINKAAENLRHADPTEAAWWFGLMSARNGKRAVRALRIFVEAVR